MEKPDCKEECDTGYIEDITTIDLKKLMLVDNPKNPDFIYEMKQKKRTIEVVDTQCIQNFSANGNDKESDRKHEPLREYAWHIMQ